MAKKLRLLLFVKEAWELRGYGDDLALETSHTQGHWKKTQLQLPLLDEL
jgi:hypothetical protein